MSISRRTVLKSALASSLIPAATSAAWAQNKTPFRIGIITDQSSVYSTVSGKGSVAALQMAVEDFGGQVLGRPIEVLSADHQNKAEIATGIAREWFDTKGVEAVFDLAQSACAMAVMGVATNMNKIVVVSSGVSSDITGKACSPVAFHWCYDTYSQASVQPQDILDAR